MTKPIGGMPSVTPGMTNGMAELATADAEAAVAGVMALVLAWSKMPLTKEADVLERIVWTICLVVGFTAESSISGMSRACTWVLRLMLDKLLETLHGQVKLTDSFADP